LFAFPGVPLTLDDSFFLSNLIAFIKVLRYNVKDYEEGGQIFD